MNPGPDPAHSFRLNGKVARVTGAVGVWPSVYIDVGDADGFRVHSREQCMGTKGRVIDTCRGLDLDFIVELGFIARHSPKTPAMIRLLLDGDLYIDRRNAKMVLDLCEKSFDEGLLGFNLSAFNHVDFDYGIRICSAQTWPRYPIVEGRRYGLSQQLNGLGLTANISRSLGWPPPVSGFIA